MFWRFILWALIAYFAIRFVVRFLIPLFSISIHTSKKMKEMQQRMNQMEQQTKQQQQPKPKEGDYIDYEEVK